MTDEQKRATDAAKKDSHEVKKSGVDKAVPARVGHVDKPSVKPVDKAAAKTKSMLKKPKPRAAVDHVSVSDGALAKIIGLSAHEVPGVVGMAPASFTEGIRRILGARQVDEGVVLARSEDGLSADVDMHVVVAYGVNIPVVAESVRDRVRYAAKLYAGIKLEKIRVHVAGVSRA